VGAQLVSGSTSRASRYSTGRQAYREAFANELGKNWYRRLDAPALPTPPIQLVSTVRDPVVVIAAAFNIVDADDGGKRRRGDIAILRSSHDAAEHHGDLQKARSSAYRHADRSHCRCS
jgi:hypothetical protein